MVILEVLQKLLLNFYYGSSLIEVSIVLQKFTRNFYQTTIKLLLCKLFVCCIFTFSGTMFMLYFKKPCLWVHNTTWLHVSSHIYYCLLMLCDYIDCQLMQESSSMVWELQIYIHTIFWMAQARIGFSFLCDVHMGCQTCSIQYVVLYVFCFLVCGHRPIIFCVKIESHTSCI